MRGHKAKRCQYMLYVLVNLSLERTLLTSSQGLEEFKLIEKMGDGAFSNVYKAVDRRSGQKVAVKVVRKYELNQSQVRQALFFGPQ